MMGVEQSAAHTPEVIGVPSGRRRWSMPERAWKRMSYPARSAKGPFLP